MHARILVLISLLVSDKAVAGDGLIAKETRGIWAHINQIDGDPVKGKAKVQQWADRFAKANLNTVYPWVESDYLAAMETPARQASVANAKWDALGELTRQCVKRGLQVHAWYSFTYYKHANSPEFRANPAWRAVRIDELVPDAKTKKVHPPWWSDVCPMWAEARMFQIKMLERMLDRYPEMTGIHVEEPGFGYAGNCFCNLCQGVFEKVYGFDQKKACNGPEATELKTLGTTAFMRELRARLLKRDPKLVLTANGGYNWRDERVLGRDWARWAQYGWLDGYAAQIYVQESNHLAPRSQLVVNDLKADCDVSVGIRINPSADPAKALTAEAGLCEQIAVARRCGAKGVVLFHAGIFTDQYAEALRAGPFKDRALAPQPRRLTSSANK